MSRTGIVFIQMLHSMIFLSNKGLSKDDVSALQGLLLWDIFLCQINISIAHRKLYAFYNQHNLNAAQLLPSQGKWQMLNFKYFLSFRFVSSIFCACKGDAYFRFAWNGKSLIWSCVHNWFYFVWRPCTAWNSAQPLSFDSF